MCDLRKREQIFQKRSLKYSYTAPYTCNDIIKYNYEFIASLEGLNSVVYFPEATEARFSLFGILAFVGIDTYY